MCMCVGTCESWGGIMWELAFCFFYVSPRDQTRVMCLATCAFTQGAISVAPKVNILIFASIVSLLGIPLVSHSIHPSISIIHSIPSSTGTLHPSISRVHSIHPSAGNILFINQQGTLHPFIHRAHSIHPSAG